MRLSTSSSNDRLPALRYGRAWLAALLLAALVVGGWELGWRARGFRPELQDSRLLWALNRSRVGADPMQVVLVGDSRAQVDIDLDAFHANFPGPRPVQLAIAGYDPVPIIRHLAEDENFRGILISSPSGIIYAQVKDLARNWVLPESYARAYENISAADVAETYLSAGVQRLFVFPAVKPLMVAQKLLAGEDLEPFYVTTTFDRVRHADFSRADLARLQRKQDEAVAAIDWSDAAPEAERQANLQALEAAVRRIQKRGGRVVFVNFPTTGETRASLERHFPRQRYWDVWARSTAALTINFLDYPELSSFDCPDYSHLDQREAAPFSAALARIIRAKLAQQPSRQP